MYLRAPTKGKIANGSSKGTSGPKRISRPTNKTRLKGKKSPAYKG